MVSPDLQKGKIVGGAWFLSEGEIGEGKSGGGGGEIEGRHSSSLSFFPRGSLPSFCGSDKKGKEKELKVWKIRASKKKGLKAGFRLPGERN